MAKLYDKLPLPDRRDEMVDACTRLLDEEVKKKKGVGGLAVKAGYKILRAFKPGAAREAIDTLFDDFIEALEPFHQEHEQGGAGSFGDHLETKAPAVAAALVEVTDRRAENSKHKNLVKAYKRMRPSALRNVEEAVPRLAVLMDRYHQG